MEARLIAVVVFVWAVCHVTEAQLPTLTALTTNITRTGCGSSKLCVSSLPNCDPLGNSSCFFSSIQVNGQNMLIELSGTTSGYVALALTASNQSEGGVVFSCGNNNSTNNTFFASTSTQSGSVLTFANVSTVNSIQGFFKQNLSLIQCVFNTTTNLTINNAKNLLISSSTTSYISILNGSTNGTNMSNATTLLTSSLPLNLTDSTLIIGAPLNIILDGCGNSKLCLSNPPACEPLGSNCSFTSSKVENQTMFFELSGRSLGYIALALKKQNTTYVFICGNNSGSFFFQTATLNGTVLIPANLPVGYYQGDVKDNYLIQCIFKTNTGFSNTDTNNSYTTSILRGSTNGTQLGNAITMYNTSMPLDLSKPSALTTLTTPSAPTTSGSNAVVSLWTQVLAVLLSAMSLHFVTK